MNPKSLLRRLDQLITGDGFWRDVQIPLRDFHLESSGATLTTTIDTNPGWDKEGTNLTTLTWAADKVVEAGLNVLLPGDYDETKDEISVWVLAKMSGDTDTPTVTVEAFTHRASDTDLAPDAIAALSDEYEWREVDLDGNSLRANDLVHLTFVPAAHTTDAVHIAAVTLRYRGDLVIYDKSERSSGTPA